MTPTLLTKLRSRPLTCMFLMTLASLPLCADAIPYPTPGSVAPTVPLFATGGDIVGYFYGSDAADTDTVALCDVTANTCSSQVFDNHSTPVGTSFDFGSIPAGHVIAFDLLNSTTGLTLSSDPSRSFDLTNHAYITPFSGGLGIPAGTYVGMEDLTLAEHSDFDYNDTQFVFTSVTPTPEPSLLILCAGLLGLLPVARRKFGF